MPISGLPEAESHRAGNRPAHGGWNSTVQDRDAEIPATTPVTTRGTGRSAWVAASVVILAMLAVVGAGTLGRATQPGPTVQPSRAAVTTGPSQAGVAVQPTDAPTPQGSAAGASPSKEPSPSPAFGSRAGFVTVAEAGYEVAYEVDATHRPAVLYGGMLAVFGFGPQTDRGSYDGTVIVSVGTPASGASMAGAGVAGRVSGTVYGATLEDLRTAYLGADPGRAVSRVALEIGGQLAIMIRFDDAGGARATALTVRGGRNFILTASGFQGLYGDVADNPAQVGLQRFIDGFRFGPPLFVSRDLGFQVPMPVEAKPVGFAAGFPLDEAQGLVVLAAGRAQPDGSFSHSIGISVGTALHPAFVHILPTGSGRQAATRIWAGSLAKLQAAYLAAVDGFTGSSSIQLGGEPAVRIERPGGLGAAVLAVHRGRVYIITTTGSEVAQAAPDFEQFLTGFAFLD